MLKSYLKSLRLISKKFSKDKRIFDIILYGSAVKGKEAPEDFDILLIFLDTNLRDRLDIVKKFKTSLRRNFKNMDVKTINLYELFDKNFLARQGILVEGQSLLYGGPLSRRLGFRGYTLFSYTLKNLNHNEKTKFTYALIGRKDRGIIKKLNAEPVGKGAIIVPVENSLIFEDFLKKWKINYKIKKILISLI